MKSPALPPLSPRLAAGLLSLLPLAALAQITETSPPPDHPTITVNAASPAPYTIPRTIFGSFLEPIGHSINQGLWAQILRNPSFEGNPWSAARIDAMTREEPMLLQSSQLGLPLPWEPVEYRQLNRYEPHWGDASNSWRSLEVIGVPGQPTGIRQKVYLPVQRTLEYHGSLFARHLSGPAGLTLSLHRRNDPTPLATAHIDAPAVHWTKYSFTLTLPPGKLARLDPADFVLELDGDERVDLDELSLMPADAVDGMDPDELRMAREMGTPLVRFGGNFTSGYHWRDGIGPLDKRVTMTNISWGIPEYNDFGTDEFLDFCRRIGAQPQIALNLGSGTPEEAADWVKYVDQHFQLPGNAQGGLLWELGNELWGGWNVGAPTLQQLPGRTLAFSQAVRAVDPNARLIATGQDEDAYKDWNAAQLTNPPGTFNYLSTHFVVTVNHVQQPHPTPDFIAAATFALPIGLGRQLQAMQQQIDAAPAFAHKAHIAFTEWLYVGPDNTPNFRNMGGAIGAAGFFNMLMRRAQIVPISDMTGIMEFAGIWKQREQVFGAPAYYAFRMYANAHATRPVQVTADAGAYSVHHGITRLPEIADAPYLDVVAALNDAGDTLTLFCVNRHLTRDLDTTIKVAGFHAAPTASLQTLASGSIYDTNTDEEPQHVVPADSTEPVHAGALHHVFPHESVTVIQLRRN